MWYVLSNYHQEKLTANKMHLLEKLHNFKMRLGEQISELLTRLEDLISQLDALEQSLSDDDLLITILKVFRREHSHAVEALQMQANLSLDEKSPQVGCKRRR